MQTEYQKLIEDNHNLIYSFLYTHHLSEDFYGDAAIGLCKAAETYDFVSSTFATYAFRCMFNECGKELKKRKREVHTVSLNKCIDYENSSDDSELCFENVFSSDDDVEEDIEFSMRLNEFLDDLTTENLRICAYRLSGMTSREIGKEIGLSHQGILNRFGRMKDIYTYPLKVRPTFDSAELQERQELKNDIFRYLEN